MHIVLICIVSRFASVHRTTARVTENEIVALPSMELTSEALYEDYGSCNIGVWLEEKRRVPSIKIENMPLKGK